MLHRLHATSPLLNFWPTNFPTLLQSLQYRTYAASCLFLYYLRVRLGQFFWAERCDYRTGSSVHRGALVLLPPSLGFLGKGKNQVFWVKKELPLIIKGVFPPLKSIVENFLGASRHLFSKFTLVYPFYLKSPPPPAYLINNYSYMHYALCKRLACFPENTEGYI